MGQRSRAGPDGEMLTPEGMLTPSITCPTGRQRAFQRLLLASGGVAFEARMMTELSSSAGPRASTLSANPSAFSAALAPPPHHGAGARQIARLRIGADSATPDQVVAAMPCFADLILHVMLCHGRRAGMARMEPIQQLSGKLVEGVRRHA